MSKIKQIKISNNIKIRYLTNNFKKKPYVVFLHGFMSDIDGEKPKVFNKFCKEMRLGFIAIEYSGHGKSTGQFTKGNISKWTNQVKIVIQKVIKKKKFILIGSSMGSWISTLQFKFFKNQIKGFIGIGSAPEFLELVMWKKFSKKMKNETKKRGVYLLKHGGYEYPITYQLIKDGRINKVLKNRIFTNASISLFHGTKDESVSSKFSKKLIKVFNSDKKKLTLIKNGNHSLFTKSIQKKILTELKNIISISN